MRPAAPGRLTKAAPSRLLLPVQVHAAIQEVRADPANLAKYRDDAAVMAAFHKLLEVGVDRTASGSLRCLERCGKASLGESSQACCAYQAC